MHIIDGIKDSIFKKTQKNISNWIELELMVGYSLR